MKTISHPRDITRVAKSLAKAHLKQDPKTTVIKFFPPEAQDEIRLLEVSKDAPTTGEVLPFRFTADAPNGVFFPSVLILLSPREWEDVEAGRLSLPSGWDLAKAKDLI